MAAFKIKDTLVALQSKIRAMGNVYEARIGEPHSPFTPAGQTRRVAAALWMTDWTPTLTLSTSVEVFTVMVRFHVDTFARDLSPDDIQQLELDLTDAFNEFTTDVQQEFDLGGNIRNVDVAGEMSEGMSAAWGHVAIANTMYRVIDITVPMIVNDIATHAA